MRLTLEQSAYFDTMDAMFMSEGWRLFMDDVKGFHEGMEGAFDTVEDLRKLGIAQGRKMTFQQILNYQELIEATKQSLIDKPEDELDAEM